MIGWPVSTLPKMMLSSTSYDLFIYFFLNYRKLKISGFDGGILSLSLKLLFLSITLWDIHGAAWVTGIHYI